MACPICDKDLIYDRSKKNYYCIQCDCSFDTKNGDITEEE